MDLDPALQVILTSTDLSTGRAFRVSRDFVGSYDFGYQPPADSLSLGTALAASTAVPVLFPPVYLPSARLGLRDAPEVLSLVDGGVYDNLGLEWFQGQPAGRPQSSRDVNFILVVDASGPLHALAGPLRGLKAVGRSRAIQYFQTRASRVRWFVGGLLDEDLRGNYLVATKDPRSFKRPNGGENAPSAYDGALPKGYGLLLADLRTDLDRFSPDEASLLKYHGYWSAHARMTAAYPELALGSPPQWREYATLSGDDDQRLRAVLRDGTKRRVHR